jgi:thioester reductase-like protein
MDRLNDSMDEAFHGKSVFLTGATGMLGTASLVKVTLDTTITRLYILVRGGSGK